MNKAEYLSVRTELGFKVKNSALCWHLLQDAFLVVSAASILRWLVPISISFYLLLSPLVAVGMYRKFGLFHDAVHGAISKNKFFNDLIGILSGPFCLLPFEPWRINHVQHHSWSGNIEKDPVMGILVAYPKLSESAKNIFRVGWRSKLPILAFAQHIVFWLLATKVFITKRWSGRMAASLIVPVLFWGAVFISAPSGFLLLSLLPGFLFYLVGTEIINLPHHLQLPQHKGETRFHFWEQFQTARSCIYPQWIARYIVLNFNYHIEHHMYPDAPWYYLQQVHDRVAPRLEGNYNLDHQFEWILRAKRQSLDDVLFGTSLRHLDFLEETASLDEANRAGIVTLRDDVTESRTDEPGRLAEG